MNNPTPAGAVPAIMRPDTLTLQRKRKAATAVATIVEMVMQVAA